VQPKPYGSFEQEVEYLEKSLGDLAVGGSTYVLGNSARSLQWHIYCVDVDRGVPLASKARTTFEVCMSDLDPICAAQFFNPNNERKASSVTNSTGIQALLPKTEIDDFIFEPCGYSMNGVENDAFSTIHVTPERECSYASFELSGYSVGAPAELVSGIVDAFKPARFCVSVTADQVGELFPMLAPEPTAPDGYACDGLTLQTFSYGGGAAFWYYNFTGQSIELHVPTSFEEEDIPVSHTPPLPETEPVLRGASPVSERLSPSPKRTRMDDNARAFAGLDKNDPATEVLTTFKCVTLPEATESVIDSYAHTLIKQNSSDTAFYMFDLGVVLRRFNAWKKYLPRVEPFYAAKCNGDPALLALLAALGAGFDCASPFEIDSVLALGVPPERIVYANACKPPSHIDHARVKNVKWTTFDNEDELRKMARVFPGAHLILRLRADDPAARCPLGDKYGAEEHEVEHLLKTAASLNLNVVGISFHVGSGATDPKSFSRAVSVARAAFDLAETFGLKDMHLLDIGGGFSGADHDVDGVTLEAVGASINAALEQHFPVSSGVRVISEPGRYFAEAAATLAGSIFGRRIRHELKETSDTHAYWISDGLYGSFNCLLYDHATVVARPLPRLEGQTALAKEELCKSTVFGPTCDGLDTVLRGTELPEMKVGDWLLFPNMGAYTLCAGSSFNGFDVKNIKVHYVFSQK